MRHILNTLFILTEDAYVALENENVVVLQEEKVLGRIPLLALENILCFTYKGASPALMGACAQAKIGLCFFSPRGRFLARSCGEVRGNVLLRKEQYRRSEDDAESAKLAADFLFGKIFNTRTLVERMKRDHPLSLDLTALAQVSAELKSSLQSLHRVQSLDMKCAVLKEMPHICTSRCSINSFYRTRTHFPWKAASRVRLSIASMPCCLFFIPCWRMIVPQRWKAWDLMRMSASCTAIAPAGNPWRSISWKNCEVSLSIASYSR